MSDRETDKSIIKFDENSQPEIATIVIMLIISAIIIFTIPAFLLIMLLVLVNVIVFNTRFKYKEKPLNMTNWTQKDRDNRAKVNKIRKSMYTEWKHILIPAYYTVKLITFRESQHDVLENYGKIYGHNYSRS